VPEGLSRGWAVGRRQPACWQPSRSQRRRRTPTYWLRPALSSSEPGPVRGEEGAQSTYSTAVVYLERDAAAASLARLSLARAAAVGTSRPSRRSDAAQPPASSIPEGRGGVHTTRGSRTPTITHSFLANSCGTGESCTSETLAWFASSLSHRGLQIATGQSTVGGMQLRGPVAVLLLTAAAYFAAGPGGLASCISSEQPPPPPLPGGYPLGNEPRGDYGRCAGLGIMPLGLGLAGVVVAIQGRGRQKVSISSPGAWNTPLSDY